MNINCVELVQIFSMEEGLPTAQVDLDVGDPYGVLNWEFKFPSNYPFSPPNVTCLNPGVFHPNVYPSGLLCLSILSHAGPGDDPSVSWSPGVFIAALLPSLKLAIAEPNVNSPADIDASKMFRDQLSLYIEENKRRNNIRLERKLKCEQEKAFKEALIEDLKNDNQKRGIQDQCEADLIEQADACARLPAEPNSKSEQRSVIIKFKSNGGDTTLARRFLCSETSSVLVMFLRSKGLKSEEYKILVGFPQRDLSEVPPDTLLSELKLQPQETFMLWKKEIDSD